MFDVTKMLTHRAVDNAELPQYIQRNLGVFRDLAKHGDRWMVARIPTLIYISYQCIILENNIVLFESASIGE